MRDGMTSKAMRDGQQDARDALCSMLCRLSDGHRRKFRRMYASNADSMDMPLAHVVSELTADRLDRALDQAERSLVKLEARMPEPSAKAAKWEARHSESNTPETPDSRDIAPAGRRCDQEADQPSARGTSFQPMNPRAPKRSAWNQRPKSASHSSRPQAHWYPFGLLVSLSAFFQHATSR